MSTVANTPELGALGERLQREADERRIRASWSVIRFARDAKKQATDNSSSEAKPKLRRAS